jgi:hypothetical protein
LKILRLKRTKLKDIVHPGRIEWTKKQLKLIPEIENNYDPKKGIITLSITNRIFDGRHRFTILYNKYGGEHTIITKKILFSKRLYNLILFSISPILFIIAIFIIILKKDKKK